MPVMPRVSLEETYQTNWLIGIVYPYISGHYAFFKLKNLINYHRIPRNTPFLHYEMNNRRTLSHTRVKRQFSSSGAKPVFKNKPLNPLHSLPLPLGGFSA